MQSKKRLDNIIKRLDALDKSNIKITLDFIRDLEHNSLAFRVSAIDRLCIYKRAITLLQDIPKQIK